MSLESVILNGLTVIAFAITNRVRGNGLGAGMPGSGRNYAAPMVAVLAWLASAHSLVAGMYPHWVMPELADAFLYAVCWFAWCLPPWGPWIALGYEPYPFPQTGAIKWFETLITQATGGNPFLGLGLRMLIGLVPVAVLFSPLYLALAPVMVVCYFLGWQTRLRWWNSNIDAIAVSELLTGGLAWGVALIILS